MSFDSEKAYINSKKVQFKDLFEIDAKDNPDLFIKYLSEHTNRQLTFALEELNKNYEELKDSGFFERDN